MKRIFKATNNHGLINLLRIFFLRIKVSIKTLYTSNPEFANTLDLYNSEKNKLFRSSIYDSYIDTTDHYNLDFSFIREFYSNILDKAQLRKIDELVIINSGVTFNTKYNQRPLNLAKYAAQKNKLVLFVTWQWYVEEPIENGFKEVYPNIFEIPMYKYLGSLQLLDEYLLKPIVWKSKTFIITLPSRDFVLNLYKLREFQFSIVYDIMDEWEEFHKLGQAIWYKKELEEQLILNSDAVFAVSRPLIEKFRNLREDIFLNGNGYDEKMLGKENKLIAHSFTNVKKKIIVGYFGHLTESWFDWPLVFELAKRNKEIIFEIIGYGCSDNTLLEIKKYSNIRYLGQKKHEELVGYAKYWQIGLIPFKNSVLSEAVDPIKIYEYLYFGIPVLSSGIPHLHTYPNTWVVENAVEADRKMKDIISGKATKNNKEEFEVFLIKTQWDERFNELFFLLKNNSFISNLTKL